MKRLILILLPVLAFAQAPYQNDTTVTMYYPAETAYITLANAISYGLYDDANDMTRNATNYPTTGTLLDAYLPIERVNWTGFTHAVLFLNWGNVQTTAPFFSLSDPSSDIYAYYTVRGPGGTTNFMKQFVDSAHANGIKVLTIIQAVSPGNLNFVVSRPDTMQLFVDSVMSFITQNNFDGVSLNWENWESPFVLSDTVAIGNFLQALRDGLDEMDPPGFLELAPGCRDWGKYPRNEMNSCVDALHPQLYFLTPSWLNGTGSVNWWCSAVYDDSPDPLNFYTHSNSAPYGWTSRGFNTAVTGQLYPTIGILTRGGDSLYSLHPGTTSQNLPVVDMARFRTLGGVDVRGDSSRGFAIAGTANATVSGDSWGNGRDITEGTKFWISFMDSVNAAEAVSYSKTLGVRHWAIFSLQNDPGQELTQYIAGQIAYGGGNEETPDYSITSGTMSEGTVGVAYADTLVGTSPVTADYRILIRGLPPGLWLRWDGVIQGTPTTAGTYTPSVRIQARNTRAKQAWKQISITINE